MQVPELYRRGVVRPLDNAALHQLRKWHVDSSIRTEWLPVLGDDHFSNIWQSGVLQRINDACGTSISDYEEVELTAPQVTAALIAISNPPLHAPDDVLHFVQNLKAVMSAAIEAGTPLFFVF